MSSTSTSSTEAAPRSSKQPSLAMTLMVVFFGTLLGAAAAAGGGFYLLSSGRISLGGSGSGQSAKQGKERSVVLEPIVANLADEGGHAFVRLGLRIELEDDGGTDAGAAAVAAPEAAAEPAKTAASGAASSKPGSATGAPAGGQAGAPGELESSIRDTVLTVLGRQKSTDLLGPDGKEHLKIELHEAIERGGVRVKVRDLFFTDFVVQS